MTPRLRPSITHASLSGGGGERNVQRRVPPRRDRTPMPPSLHALVSNTPSRLRVFPSHGCRFESAAHGDSEYDLAQWVSEPSPTGGSGPAGIDALA